ncbi:hypothetical protein [Ornithinimicrobium kibberense]|uniref:hypothetical protein n=1 Tax=Ornithinimicrobium kibberense TaxID=282060 RepID=UPI003607474E
MVLHRPSQEAGGGPHRGLPPARAGPGRGDLRGRRRGPRPRAAGEGPGRRAARAAAAGRGGRGHAGGPRAPGPGDRRLPARRRHRPGRQALTDRPDEHPRHHPGRGTAPPPG